MPTYTYLCGKCSETVDQISTVAERNGRMPVCCDEVMTRQLSAVHGYVQAGLHGCSPVTGEPLTTRRARIEHMKRHDLQEALPAAEVIRNANAKKAAREKTEAETPHIPAPVLAQIHKELAAA